jgi:hypothetical protein
MPANERACPKPTSSKSGTGPAFDSLEGCEFRTARDAERAARALLEQRQCSASQLKFAAAF